MVLFLRLSLIYTVKTKYDIANSLLYLITPFSIAERSMCNDYNQWRPARSLKGSDRGLFLNIHLEKQRKPIQLPNLSQLEACVWDVKMFMNGSITRTDTEVGVHGEFQGVVPIQ
jgi:hypothetical protein